MTCLRKILSVPLSQTSAPAEKSPDVAVICHCEAAWLSPASGSEKTEPLRLAMAATPLAASAGDSLAGW